MAARTYVSLGQVISQDVWPSDVFGTADFDFLDAIAYVDGKIFDDDLYTNIVLDLEVVQELTFDLPFGLALVVGAGPVSFTMTGDDLGFTSWTDAGVLKLRLPRELFVPLIEGTTDVDPDPTRFVEITFDVGMSFDSRGNIDLAWPAEGPTPLTLERCMIGNTGVIISAEDVLIRLSEEQQLPDEAAALGIGPDFRGLFIGEATVELAGDLADAIPAGSELKFKNCLIGTGGFTGTLTVIPGASPQAQLFGASFTFQSFELEIVQNALTKFEIKGALDLAVLDDPLDVIVSVDLDGKILIRLSQQGGLVQLGVQNVFTFTVDKIEFEVDDTGQLAVRTSGTFTPTFQPGGPHLDWPGIRLENLEIDSDGHVRIAGGWIDLPTQATLDLYGFILEITRIGFGTTDQGQNWIGFNGALRIMEGIPAGASVDGLRIIWGGPDPAPPTRITMEGIGVQLEVPGAIRFAGSISLTGQEFAGAVRVELPAISFEIDGQFVAGTVENSNPPVKTYAVFLQMQLPAGIPLGPTGLAFYGFAGLFAHNREPAKDDAQGWYRNPDFSDGWFTTKTGTPPVEGVTDLRNKWRGAPGHMGLGAGIIIGTFPDNGYIFNGRLLLVLAFPGPTILLDGMANLFKKRTELGSAEPNFHALIVIEPGKSFLAGLDALYRFKDGGELLDIHGSAEAFFSFDDPLAWFINLGVAQPPSRRIGARIFQLFDVNGFFMLSPKSLAVGAGWGFDHKYGFKHLFVRLFASMEGAATVSWHPAHFTGSVGLSGGAEACAFGICIGFSVGASITGDVFDPFALTGAFNVSLELPWPLPDISKTITLSWSFDFSDSRGPELPVPIREVSVEHLKSGNTWPLLHGQSLRGDDGANGASEFERRGGEGAPATPGDVLPPFDANVAAPRVPADTKVALTFTRPIKDALPVANADAGDLKPEQIGDPHPGSSAAYTAGYTLSSVDLQKWAPGGQGTDGSARWVTVLQGGPGPDEDGRLIGEWVPGHEDHDQGHSEQHKLVINAVTPFDYTAGRSSTWEQAFYNSNPGYPCPLAVPGLSARFTQPIGTVIDTPYSFPAPMPAFTVSWGYGGEIVESEDVISTVLGPIDRGVRVTAGGGFFAPPGTRTYMIRVGTARELSFSLGEIQTQLGNPGDVANPVAVGDGVVTAFDGLSAPFTQRSGNKVVLLSDKDTTGLEIGDRLEIDIKPSLMVEIVLELVSVGDPNVDAYVVLADGSILGHPSPPVGESTLRFNSSDPLIVKVVIQRRAARLFLFGALKRVSARQPFQVLISRENIAPTTQVESNGLIVIDDLGVLTNVVFTSGYGSGTTVLELAFAADNDALVRRTVTSLNRLKKEDPLFEPDADYRLVVSTNRADQTLGGNASVLNHSNDFVNHAYFHVVEPPGIGAPDTPPNQNPDAQAGLALDDLRLYVEQTLPPTIPPDNGKLLLPRAFYRGCDVAVKFNVPHAELLYVRARRDLSVRLYDVDNNPILMPDGRVSIPVPSWERSRQSSLTDSVTRWITAVNQTACHPDDVPPFEPTSVVRPQVLSSPNGDIVIAAETLHHAHLVPALLHETFVQPLPGLIADGDAHRLERWVANTDSFWQIDSETIDDPDLGSVTVFFVKEVNGSTASLFFSGSLIPDDSHPDSPKKWSDFRASFVTRWATGIVGFDFRAQTGGDFLRLTLERDAADPSSGTRRLVKVVGNVSTELAKDTTTFPGDSTDVAITVECVGSRVRVYQDDGLEPILDVNNAPTLAGTVGLYVQGASSPRFTEIRVDDLRPTPSTAFIFDFVSSKYTNFYHHLHSFPDQVFDGAPATPLSAADLAGQAGNAISIPASGGDGLGTISDDERRSFEALEAQALGQEALQTPEGFEILRVSAAGAPTALMVRSPEPLLWERTLLEVSATSDQHTFEVPGDLKLTDVTFGGTPADESVTVLVRTAISLANYQLQWRPLPDAGNSDPAWTTYFAFPADEPQLADGTQVHVLALAGTEDNRPTREPGSVQRFVAPDQTSAQVHFSVPGVELRLLAPDGKTVAHQRRFATPDAFTAFPMQALRKQDGTALILFTTATGPAPAALRLKWTFNRAAGDEDLRFRQGGSDTPDVATLDFVLPSGS